MRFSLARIIRFFCFVFCLASALISAPLPSQGDSHHVLLSLLATGNVEEFTSDPRYLEELYLYVKENPLVSMRSIADHIFHWHRNDESKKSPANQFLRFFDFSGPLVKDEAFRTKVVALIELAVEVNFLNHAKVDQDLAERIITNFGLGDRYHFSDHSQMFSQYYSSFSSALSKPVHPSGNCRVSLRSSPTGKSPARQTEIGSSMPDPEIWKSSL